MAGLSRVLASLIHQWGQHARETINRRERDQLKLSASVPDHLWTIVQHKFPEEGTSAIVQRALLAIISDADVLAAHDALMATVTDDIDAMRQTCQH